MNHETLQKSVESMVEKASKAEKADDALKFSQAACNAANAMNTLYHVESVKAENDAAARDRANA